jgi:hypothetical protein
MTPHRIPGAKWFGWIRNPTARIGVLTGVYLSAVAIVALFAANRMPFLEPFAELRNWTARVAFALAMTIPVFSHLRVSFRAFAGSVLGWGAVLAVGVWFGLSLDSIPQIRGWAGVITILMLVHFGFLTRNPVKMFFSALLGWSLFTVTYTVLGQIFVLLHSRFFSPLHLFIFGMILYGVMAGAGWIAQIAVSLREQRVNESHRSA